MKKVNLLICGNCETQGFKEIVGEVDESGAVLVQRFHRGYTKVIGNFSIICGRCGIEIFFKERRQNEDSYIGITWIHIISFTGSTVEQRLQSGTNYERNSLLTNGTSAVL